MPDWCKCNPSECYFQNGAGWKCLFVEIFPKMLFVWSIFLLFYLYKYCSSRAWNNVWKSREKKSLRDSFHIHIFDLRNCKRRLSFLKMIHRVSCFRLSQWSSTWLWSKYFSEIWSLTAYLEMTLCLSKKIRSKKFICIMFVNLCILFSFYLAWFVCVFICMFNLSM